MRFKRAISVGILFWMLIFVEISITMIGLKLSNSLSHIVHYVLLIPIALLCTWLYYMNHKSKIKDRTNGLLLGLFFVIIGIILDIIITVPIFIMPQGGTYASYFSGIYLIVGFIETILIVGIYNAMRN
jgi:hypothetical protein